MRATVFRGPGDVRVEEVPRPELTGPEDAIVRITHTAICGSDLWFYRGESDRETPSRVGHEPMGIVEATGESVRRVRDGDRVFAPFAIGCGECQHCQAGWPTSCERGESWSDHGGAQSEVVRVPHADGTLVRVPDRYADDESALEALLPLTDVMGTGHHAAVSAGVEAGSECVVIGDGAVGLCGVLAARRLGAKHVVAVGHHDDRLALAESFGADATVRGDRGDPVERIREATHGGVDHAMECVGAASAMATAVGVTRPGGTVGYVGVPHAMDDFPIFDFFEDNVTLAGGVAPVREYAEALMADVLGGTLDPSPIFTKTVELEDIAEGYEAMDDREAIKVLVRV